VVINDYRIPSAPILSGKTDYPEGIAERIGSKADTVVIRAAEIAELVGNPRTMNIVLFGALVQLIGLTDIDWESVIREEIKPTLVEVNLKALNAGMEAAKNHH
jgi:indolepyruvate ferredoxin oxidoreductase beta subunit